MKISFVNMIQDVAMKLGNLDVDVVTTALANSTKRIVSSKYMKAGMGDGGSCHPRDNIALQWLSDELNLGYNLFGAIVYAREMQAKNLAKFLISLSKKHRLPITIIGRSFKPGVEYDDGSPAILVSNYIKKCNFDDFSKPAVFLLAHSSQTTYGDKNEEYTFPENSIIVDPWRERDYAIHYGNSK